MSQFVDTHCHIQSAGGEAGERTTTGLWAKAPDLTPESIIQDANDAGVTRLICVGCDVSDSRLAVDFAQRHKNCWASIGIHPHEAKKYVDNTVKLANFDKLVKAEEVVAIGECGLDYYYNHSPKTDQERILRHQIELALKHDLPIIFHVREAFDDFWPIFESYDGIRGALHSFTDSLPNMQKAVEKGLYIGVNGIATFAKDPAQIAVYKAIPLNKLLLETDAPFLAPVPHRGKTNEPKYIPAIATFLSELRREGVTQIAESTTNNAKKLFGDLA